MRDGDLDAFHESNAGFGIILHRDDIDIRDLDAANRFPADQICRSAVIYCIKIAVSGHYLASMIDLVASRNRHNRHPLAPLGRLDLDIDIGTLRYRDGKNSPEKSRAVFIAARAEIFQS